VANETDHHDITEILLKVTMKTIKQTKPTYMDSGGHQQMSRIVFLNSKVILSLSLSLYM
jgi:hypothetical protein